MKLEWSEDKGELIIEDKHSLLTVIYRKKITHLKLRAYLNDLSIVDSQVIGLSGLLQCRLSSFGESNSSHLLRIHIKSYYDIDESETCFSLSRLPRQFGITLNQSLYVLTLYIDSEVLEQLLDIDMQNANATDYLGITLQAKTLKGMFTTQGDNPQELKLLDYEILNNLAQSDDSTYDFIDSTPDEVNYFNEDDFVFGEIWITRRVG
tara:strand:- start:1090 stop:1710 length:621 start_codon:yes stop_codon:yes gene_type:complete